MRTGSVELGEAEQPGQPGHVGVDRQAGQAEADAADHVRGLAAHARQRDQVVDGGRHLAAETLVKGPAEADQALGLGPEEPRRVDERLQLIGSAWPRSAGVG